MRARINETGARMSEFAAFIDEKGVSIHQTRAFIRRMGKGFPQGGKGRIRNRDREWECGSDAAVRAERLVAA